MSTLSELKTDLLSLLADYDDNAGWEDGVLEEALRRGLRMYCEHGRPTEASFTVTTAGYEQDLASLLPLKIHSVMVYFSDGVEFWANLWRQVGATTVRFDGNQLAVGDVLRVRYQKLQTIEDLDGGTSTTVPSIDEATLLLAAAHWACLLRYRQVSRAPSSAKTDVAGLHKLAVSYETQFYQAINLAYDGGVVSWSGIGL